MNAHNQKILEDDIAARWIRQLERWTLILQSYIPDPYSDRELPETDASDRQLLRTAARLRQRKVDPPDSRMTHDELADFYEKRVQARAAFFDVISDSCVGQLFARYLAAKDIVEQLERDRMALHLAKQLPDARDPNSQTANLVRELNHARRKQSERPRHRARRTSGSGSGRR
jgi:hypothetical protein